jgi:hypothetical protein
MKQSFTTYIDSSRERGLCTIDYAQYLSFSFSELIEDSPKPTKFLNFVRKNVHFKNKSNPKIPMIESL